MKAFKVQRNGQTYFRVDLAKEFFTDGKRHSVMASTRRAAIAKAEKIIEDRKQGIDSKGSRLPLSEFLIRFLDFYKTEGGVSQRTWQDYHYQIVSNISPLIGGVALGDLKPLGVDLWMKSLRARGLSDRSVEYAQSVLRRALQFALEWEMITRNPASARFRAAKRKRSVQPGKKIQFLNPDECRRFRALIVNDRHQALYTLALTTGLRPEELYGLRWIDVDLEKRRLTVNQAVTRTRLAKGAAGARYQFSPPKTKQSRRTIEVPPFVIEMLKTEKNYCTLMRQFAGDRWIENGLVFPSQIGTPLDESNVLLRFQKTCTDNGLPKLRLYDLRHTHASLLINEGVHPKKIAARLGHASITLTMDTYGHLFDGSDQDAADKIEQIFRVRKEEESGQKEGQ